MTGSNIDSRICNRCSSYTEVGSGDEKEHDQMKAMQLLKVWAAGNAVISAPTLWQYEVKELPWQGGGGRGKTEKMDLCYTSKFEP